MDGFLSLSPWCDGHSKPICSGAPAGTYHVSLNITVSITQLHGTKHQAKTNTKPKQNNYFKATKVWEKWSSIGNWEMQSKTARQNCLSNPNINK